MTEKQIQNAILRAYGADPRLRLWRANAGVGFYRKGTAVRFGVPGQADLTGILPNGQRLEVEVKTVTGRQSKDQHNYQRMIEAFGGVYILARSVEDVAAVIEPILADAGYPATDAKSINLAVEAPRYASNK